MSDSGTATMPTRLQQLVLDDLSKQYKAMGRPPSDITTAGALVELCGAAGPCIFDHGGPAPFQEGDLALPDEPPSCSVEEAIASEHLKPLDSSGDTVMHTSDKDILAEIDTVGTDSPCVDPAFRSLKINGQFLSQLVELEIISSVPDTGLFGHLFCEKENRQTSGDF